MRFQALAALATALCLAACAAAGDDGESSSAAETESPPADAGTPSSDGGTPTDPEGGPVDAGPAVPTYAEEAPVIAAHCGSCHGTKFNTLAKVKSNKTKMIQKLEAQEMPKDDTTWSTTPDGQAFLDFLANDPELD